ncbi:MAG: alpha-D-glucose phosphate-specific phosphoglucomutase [Hyphomicrobiales bacterium]
MIVETIKTTPFDDQKPGTSGLRKQVKVFSKPKYLNNFIQAIFDAVPSLSGNSLVLGGDGRYFSREAIDIIIRIAAGNGVRQVILGTNGLLATPAASHLIRERGAAGGILLTASHNPGGPDGDFGVKFNSADGGSAPGEVMSAIYESTKTINSYKWCSAEMPTGVVGQIGVRQFGDMEVETVDSVSAYADLQESLFDFAAIREWLVDHTMMFDAMHGVTGPYAVEIFGNRLGVDPSNLMRCNTLEDFGGLSPDPNLVHARELYEVMMSADGPELAAASDGDGDRNLIIGRHCYVSPSDSLAVLAANAPLVPAFAGGLKGAARSMPTSSALDRVAEANSLLCFETPTGWKYFSELLEANRISICGEESAGTGADHIREKDGPWAVLFWLNILAKRKVGVAAIMQDHFATYGRTFHRRHDFEGLDSELAAKLMTDLESKLPKLSGNNGIKSADNFSYESPVGGGVTEGQGIRIITLENSRMIFRLSGTGTSGATLRLYLEQYTKDAALFNADPDKVLLPLSKQADQIAEISDRTGRTSPDVVT